MRISTLAFATGMLTQAPTVDAWWGEDLWDWMFGDDSNSIPIALRKWDNSESFQDRCIPSDDCWPSSDEWDQLNQALGGKLLMDVEPVLEPCFNKSSIEDQAECQRLYTGFSDAYVRDDIPGAMMMPMFECNMRTAECCAEQISPTCH